MIKPYDNGGLASVVDYMTQKVLIIDTTLRLFIPPQVGKITPKLCHIFGCEIYIISKDMHIYLNISRIILVTYLQNNYVGINTLNVLFITKSYLHYKDKVFPDGEFLHDIITDADQCITYLHIKTNNMINIKCDLFFCDECPE